MDRNMDQVDPHAKRARVNINEALEDQFENVLGLDRQHASAIVEHRREHGQFAYIEDLVNVSGFTDRLLEELRPRITV